MTDGVTPLPIRARPRRKGELLRGRQTEKGSTGTWAAPIDRPHLIRVVAWTRADRTAIASERGRSSWPASRPRPAWRSSWCSTRPEPRSGAASSTASSASSRSTGEAGPSPTSAPSSSSSPRRQPRQASPLSAHTIPPGTPQASRSPNNNSTPCPSKHTTGTANGTTPSPPNAQTNPRRLPTGRAHRCAARRRLNAVLISHAPNMIAPLVWRLPNR